MDNNLGFRLKRRRGLVIETLHLDEGGGTSERRTKPSETQNEINKAPAVGSAQHAHSHGRPHTHTPVSQDGGDAQSAKPIKKKLERRKIRFDDDPNENPSGILGLNSSKPASAPIVKISSIRPDKPELYDF